MDAAHYGTCELFEIGDDGTERVAVIWIAVQRFGMQHELAAFGRDGGRGNRHLATCRFAGPISNNLLCGRGSTARRRSSPQTC